jgi:antitoxin VapB
MTTTSVFNSGNSQAVRIPPEYRVTESELLIQTLGSALILVPKEDVWQTFRRGLDGFSADFTMERDQPAQQERAGFDEV